MADSGYGSEEGIRHRGRRCIEPEAVFGQMKHNMAYRRSGMWEKKRLQWTLHSLL
ncbi:transposase [Bacteroides xylanisolvens]|uniref:transposase n=1 Tax=Bacteroides xylanisolvens TaxID=371601 RepID=UPI003CCC5FE4